MSNYYDIDDLLYQEQKITVAFAHQVIIQSKKYKKNKKIELPIYIVDFFIQNDHCTHFLDNETENTLLKADCTLVNFKNTFYYEHNRYLKDMFLYEIFCIRMHFYLKLIYEDHVDKQVLGTLEYTESKIIKKARKMWRLYN